MCLPLPTVVTVAHLNPQQRELARTIVRKQAAGFGIQVKVFGHWTKLGIMSGYNLVCMSACDTLPFRTTTLYADGSLKSTQRINSAKE